MNGSNYSKYLGNSLTKMAYGMKRSSGHYSYFAKINERKFNHDMNKI